MPRPQTKQLYKIDRFKDSCDIMNGYTSIKASDLGGRDTSPFTRAPSFSSNGKLNMDMLKEIILMTAASQVGKKDNVADEDKAEKANGDGAE
jgi:hypothetical protein